jgi:membrane-associated phospholipid phosphatase
MRIERPEGRLVMCLSTFSNGIASKETPMEPAAEWLSTHALSVWALLLAMALLGADVAWRRASRRRQRAEPGTEISVLRPLTGIAIVLALVLISVALGVAVREQAGLTRFDAGLAQDLRTSMPLPVLRGISWVTHLGDPLLVAGASALVTLILAIRRHIQLAIVWTVALAGTALINSGLKTWFERARPLNGQGYIVEHSWSFPSGHASGSMAFYGMLAYVLLRLLPARHHRAVIMGAALLITIVGISRILLQVHYFSDVLAGYTTGAAWLTLCIGTAETLRLRSKPGRAPTI